VIVGDGPERSALEQLAAERFPRTRFLGHLEGDSLSIAFGASDVFVLPGTGGLAIYEAMAHGKPVIVGQGDGTESDLVYNGRNGCHVSPGDVGALTSAIQAYLRQPELVIKAGQESRRIVEEEVSIDRMSSAFVHALQFAETVTGVE
jgi:glycosyltransferase involved in cell wall biosynthesis